MKNEYFLLFRCRRNEIPGGELVSRGDLRRYRVSGRLYIQKLFYGYLIMRWFQIYQFLLFFRIAKFEGENSDTGLIFVRLLTLQNQYSVSFSYWDDCHWCVLHIIVGQLSGCKTILCAQDELLEEKAVVEKVLDRLIYTDFVVLALNNR